ncbi:Imm6 family immunity protein [Conchiformibius kuhniae]|uniref:Imm6 family immunity protein n=1 Tax=Conchiformibius kuhniae TaxID=211502 RepID=A0A8T9MTI6_9NEIS|nr:Imm6 family immunity protein [Conchiformibius kuhniae]UOP04571.1 immunity 6 family protein [Conchiformibius kuhniae]
MDFKNQKKQAVFMLVYSELIFRQLNFSHKEIIRNALNLCWKWIANQDISADTIYSTLDDGTDFGGICILMQLDKNEENILKLDNIVYAISYISLLAYQKENSNGYLPPILENIDENTIVLFMENLSKMNLLHINSYQD